nr:hypothetical protein [uncultured Acidocella sp.]
MISRNRSKRDFVRLPFVDGKFRVLPVSTTLLHILDTVANADTTKNSIFDISKSLLTSGGAAETNSSMPALIVPDMRLFDYAAQIAPVVIPKNRSASIQPR